jgi:hypothetical protein
MNPLENPTDTSQRATPLITDVTPAEIVLPSGSGESENNDFEKKARTRTRVRRPFLKILFGKELLLLVVGLYLAMLPVFAFQPPMTELAGQSPGKWFVTALWTPIPICLLIGLILCTVIFTLDYIRGSLELWVGRRSDIQRQKDAMELPSPTNATSVNIQLNNQIFNGDDDGTTPIQKE